MTYIKLWQFNLGTLIVTILLLGVEGWVAWAIPAAMAWALTRQQPLGAKNYTWPFATWAVLIAMMVFGRT